MTRTVQRLTVAAAFATLAACGNAGSDLGVGITATGSVIGAVYFDANGSGTRDAGDTPMVGVRVAVVTPLSRDTVRAASSDIAGEFRISGVPVGSYAIVVDSGTIGDSVEVVGLPAGTIALAPDDSVDVDALLSFPFRTAAEVRSGTLGDRVFLTGVALHGRALFSDTLFHVVDTTGALRATRVRPTSAVAGDSLRLRGRIAERDGQRVLDDVTVFVLGATFIPTVPTLTSAVAATAAAGAQDAALVRVLDAAVVDTATVNGNLRVRVNDGSGVLSVVLDRAADGSFRPPFVAGAWTAGRRYDFIGVLVPSGVGTWALRPRSALDLLAR